MKTKPHIKPAERILKLPKYIFAELDEWKLEAIKKGQDLIDLGMGNPDGATPSPIVEAAIESIKKPESHRYPSFKGKEELRQSIADWMLRRYNVKVNSETEIQTLVGAKEGIAHIALAYTNPGDINIVPDPYYPVLSRGTWIASGEVYHVPLLEKNGFLPDLSSIPEDVAKKARMFIVNYPNNPTSAVVTKEYYKELIDFCIKYDILLVTDLAYGEICFDGYRPPSIFEVEGAWDVAVEFHSFSKTFNMAGWRVGFVIGNQEFIKAIHAIKTNTDYGTSTIVQDAAIKALNIDQSYIDEICNKYQRRRDFVCERLRKLGWDAKKTKATMYYWLKVPEGRSSKEWCKEVLDATGVVLTPGVAFGDYSDGYFRLSLVAPDEKIKEALNRLEKAGFYYK